MCGCMYGLGYCMWLSGYCVWVSQCVDVGMGGYGCGCSVCGWRGRVNIVGVWLWERDGGVGKVVWMVVCVSGCVLGVWIAVCGLVCLD